jgi:hypothetical protein
MRSAQAGLVLVILLLAGLLTAFAGSHPDRATGAPVNNFLNSYTLIQTATDTSFFAIMAVGATIVIISAGIDLSVGSVYALSGVTMGLALRAAAPIGGVSAVLMAFGVCVVVGLAAGALNGMLVVGLRVHPFIVTLGSMWILRGIAFVAEDALQASTGVLSSLALMVDVLMGDSGIDGIRPGGDAGSVLSTMLGGSGECEWAGHIRTSCRSMREGSVLAVVFADCQIGLPGQRRLAFSGRARFEFPIPVCGLADVPAGMLSRATSLTSMAQQLSQTVGVAELLGRPDVAERTRRLYADHGATRRLSPPCRRPWIPMPALSLVSAIPLTQTLAYKEVGSLGKAKPFGAVGVELWRAVGTVPAVDPAQCDFVGIHTKTPLTQGFDPGDQGKIVTYFARFSTRSGPAGVAQTGPWSSPLSMVIM